MKEQSVRVQQVLIAPKNIAQKECALIYWASVWLKMKEIYSIEQKIHKIKPEQANGDYSFQPPRK